MSTVILDLDGTLVDSVPLHVMTWHDAFVAAGRPVPTRRLHAAIGLGSTRLVPHVLGEIPDEDLVEEVVEGHRSRFLERADVLQPTPGATALLDDLTGRGVAFVVATAAGSDERAALLSVLGDPDVPVTDDDDISGGKPDAEPIRAAAVQIGVPIDRTVVVVGDSPWDGYAAVAAGARFVAVRAGGFCDATLRQASAERIADDPAGLLGSL